MTDIWDTFDEWDNNVDVDKNVEEDGCPMCNKTDTLVKNYKDGIIVCNECGIICNEILDHNPEWNSGSGSKGGGRYGMATNFFLPKSSLGTSIAGPSYNRLKRLHLWGAMPYRERSLYMVLDDITTRCKKNGIKKYIIDDAKLMYKKISEYKHVKGKNKNKFIIIRGSNRKSIIAACVFYACKLNGDTRSPREMANIFDLKLTEITRGCKKFLPLMKNYENMYRLGSSKPEHFIARFCVALDVKKKDIKLAKKIAKNIRDLGLVTDHTPPSVAAGSILLMSKINGINLTKKSISDTFGISEVTVTKIYKKIVEYKNIIASDKKTQQLLKLLAE